MQVLASAKKRQWQSGQCATQNENNQFNAAPAAGLKPDGKLAHDVYEPRFDSNALNHCSCLQHASLITIADVYGS